MPSPPPSPADSFFSSTTAHLAARAIDHFDDPPSHSATSKNDARDRTTPAFAHKAPSAASTAAPSFSPPPAYPPALPSIGEEEYGYVSIKAAEKKSPYSVTRFGAVDGSLGRPSSSFSRAFRDEQHDEEADTPLLTAPAEYQDGGGAGAAALAYPPFQAWGKDGSASQQPASDTPPPEGGLKGWLNVLGGWLLMFASFGYVNAFGVFQSYYKLAVFPEKSEEDISWIGSIQLCLFFLMSLVAGPLFDKGLLRPLVAVGSAMWIASIFLIPHASKYWHAIVIQAVLGGMGVGLLFLPALSIQSHWFTRRRNLAIGIVASASSLGGIAFPIMLNKLFAHPSVGFANGVRASGGVVAACLVAGNFLVSPNPARKNVKKPPPAPFKQLFSVPYTLLALGAMIMNLGLWFPNFYIQVYGLANGVDSELAFYLLAIFNAGSFFGRTVPNVIADFTGPFLVQSICIVSAGIVLFTMLVAKTATSIIVFAALYGFFSGGFISLVSPVIVGLSNDLSEIGLRQGIAFLIVAGAAVGGNPIAGRLLKNNDNDFRHPIVFAATMVTAGGLLGSVGCYIAMKQKRTWRV
ncbi:hypothetical protein JCM6882_006558 [Rhodosporidiobolus microsporus]